MDVVTGAFSYTGSYIARRLLESGRCVRTLSRVPDPEYALAPEVEFAPLDDEVRGLELGLLVSSEPPAGRRRFSDFLSENSDALGRTYLSELARNFRPYAAV